MKPQCRQVLDYMKRKGSITVAEAFQELSIGSLTSRISELKAAGYKINGSVERGFNKFGDTVHYKKYYLGGN